MISFIYIIFYLLCFGANHWEPLAITSLHFPLYFVVLPSLNSVITEAPLPFTAQDRRVLDGAFSKRNRPSREGVTDPPELSTLFIVLFRGGNSSSKPRAPSGRPGKKGKDKAGTRTPPPTFCRDFLALPQFAFHNGNQPGPVGINHKTPVADELRFSLTCNPPGFSHSGSNCCWAPLQNLPRSSGFGSGRFPNSFPLLRFSVILIISIFTFNRMFVLCWSLLTFFLFDL